MNGPPRVSVVVISRNEGADLRATVENLDDTLPGTGEIVVIDDGSTDGSADRVPRRRGRVRLKRGEGLGVAQARNWGARLSRGDIVVFADAHIRVEPFWWRPLAEMLADPRVGGTAPGVTHMTRKGATGYGLTLTGPDLDAKWLQARGSAPFPAPILPGCCLAMRRAVFEATRGWDEGMLLRGGVDNEGSVRFWLMGYDLFIVPEVVVRHRFRKKSPYPVAWGPYLHNRLRLAFAHLKATRLGKVVKALTNYDALGEALELLVEKNISEHREYMQTCCVRSDDWYFERFGMKW
jgi:glycosyltransferase involved in cell wall biosynthesis